MPLEQESNDFLVAFRGVRTLLVDREFSVKWFVVALVVVAGSWVAWDLLRPDTGDSYEIVEVERHGITVKLAKNGEYCHGTWDGYAPIPETAEWLGPHVFAQPMRNDPGVYLEIYLTDGTRSARAAGTETCWEP
jgi:hypothetical protein